MRRTRDIVVFVAGLALSLALVLSAGLTSWRPNSVRAVYTSPSGEYRLVVHRYVRVFALPGDGTGGPGYVELFARAGNKLGEARVPVLVEVSSPSNIRWRPTDVSVPGVFDFPLPRP